MEIQSIELKADKAVSFQHSRECRHSYEILKFKFLAFHAVPKNLRKWRKITCPDFSTEHGTKTNLEQLKLHLFAK